MDRLGMDDFENLPHPLNAPNLSSAGPLPKMGIVSAQSCGSETGAGIVCFSIDRVNGGGGIARKGPVG
jgi:hypothetical protein